MSSCRKKLHGNSSKKWCFKETTSFLQVYTSMFLQQISKQTEEIFRGVFFQILCYQTEIKVDSTPPVVVFDRHGHFSFNV